MSGNTFGRVFRLTTFGESHGPGLGGVVDGCPAGIPLIEEDIQKELDKRRPGTSLSSTTRQESDKIEVLSGLFNGYTTGTSIGFLIPNTGQKSKDYEALKDIFRPGHADYTYQAKYGIRDYRGGGRSSGRETVSRVAGGAIAQKFLAEKNIQLLAYTVELGGIEAEVIAPEKAQDQPYFTPESSVVELWNRKVEKAKKDGDSIGGLVEVQALGVPPGLGEPVFDKLDARLAYALMGVGAVKAVEVGIGKDVIELTGSRNNDPLKKEGFTQNNAGGILGGISTGQPVVVRCAIKPIPSISKPQKTINKMNENVILNIKGRHDVSAIPRIVPVLKSMVALVLADMYLLQTNQEHKSL